MSHPALPLSNSSPKTPPLIGRGARLGLIAGLIASVIYVLGFALFFYIASAVTAGSLTNIINAIFIEAVPLAFFIIIYGLLMGVLPAVVLGPLTGAIIGATMQWLYPYLSKQRALAIGVIVCLLLTTLLLYLLHTFNYSRMFGFLGLPILMYIGIGGIMSWRLYTAVEQELQHTS